MPRLTSYKALTFDCYGTLIDWEGGMVAALAPLTATVGRPLSRDAILEAHAREALGQPLLQPDLRPDPRHARRDRHRSRHAGAVAPDDAGGPAVGDMLQDLERGRPMEIDALVAAVQELGRAVGMVPSLLDSVLQAKGETLVGPIGISPKAGAMDPELTDVVKA